MHITTPARATARGQPPTTSGGGISPRSVARRIGSCRRDRASGRGRCSSKRDQNPCQGLIASKDLTSNFSTWRLNSSRYLNSSSAAIARARRRVPWRGPPRASCAASVAGPPRTPRRRGPGGHGDFFRGPRGTGSPARRACASPIAIACLRLVTFAPVDVLSVPRFRSCMTCATFALVFFVYLAMALGSGGLSPRLTT